MLTNRSKVILGSCSAATLAVTAFVIDGERVFGDADDPQSSSPIRHPLPRSTKQQSRVGRPGMAVAISHPIEHQPTLQVAPVHRATATMDKAAKDEGAASPSGETSPSSGQDDSIDEPANDPSRQTTQELPLELAQHLDLPQGTIATRLDAPLGKLASKPIVDEEPFQLEADLRTAELPPPSRNIPFDLPLADNPETVAHELLASHASDTIRESHVSYMKSPSGPGTSSKTGTDNASAKPMPTAEIDRATGAKNLAKTKENTPKIAQAERAAVETDGRDTENPPPFREPEPRHRAAYKTGIDRPPLPSLSEARERAKGQNHLRAGSSLSAEGERPGRVISASVKTQTTQGTLPLQVSDDELVSIRLSDLISLFEHKMDRSLFVWLKTSAEASKFVTPNTLRNAGIDVEFNSSSNQLILTVGKQGGTAKF